jgi:hypothetical protein
VQSRAHPSKTWAFGEPKKTSPLARSGSRYPGSWCERRDSNPQAARVVRSRNPRRYGVFSLSGALSSARCGKSVADECRSGGAAFASRSNCCRTRQRTGDAAAEPCSPSSARVTCPALKTSHIPPASRGALGCRRVREGTGGDDHFAPATSFWNRGFLRSASKLGSIFSQPGERMYGIFNSGSSWSSAFSGSPTRM